MNLQENIRRILREESAKQALIQMIKDDGIKAPIQIVNGANNLIKVMGIKTPMDFLDIFDNLKPVRSIEQPRWMLYRYKEGDNIFVYNTKNDEAYINYSLWYAIKDGFDLTYFKTQEICKEWLEQKYEIKVKNVFSSSPGSEHLTI